MSEQEKNILDYDTVAYDTAQRELVILDQTKLPGKTEILRLKRQEDIWHAIHVLQVRGAPAIGVAAAIAMSLAAYDIPDLSYDIFYQKFKKARDYLATSRPTAVNLFWALDRMEQVVRDNKDKNTVEIRRLLQEEALAIRAEDIWVSKKIGEYGLTLVKPGDGLLTHCNAGQLATVKYGTATAPMYLGYAKDYHFRIFCDETRPLLQGARLTAYELASAGMDVTLLCDNMCASVMQKGWIQAVFVGCDRVAANGDTANKIGTSVVAAVAKRYGVPFYVCAPTSTIDRNCLSGDAIRIEERKPEEVTEMWYKERMAPPHIKVYNPAFDVTPADLITGIVTEYGIAKAPYDQSLAEIFRKKEEAQKGEKE